jgi:ferredoxin
VIGRGERQDAGATSRLRIDPVACDGVGVCAHLASSLIELDRWGYPVFPVSDLSRAELAAAQRAVQGCPRKALWIERVDVPVPTSWGVATH